mgnify:CR=1 FL=1
MSLQDTRKHRVLRDAISTPHDLNLSTGLSGMLTDSIVEHRNRESARNGVNATEQIRKRKATAQTAIDNHKKLSSGLLFTSGTCRSGPEMIDKAIESKQITTNVQTAKELAAQKRYDALLHRVETVRASPKEKEAFNISDLRTLVLWYKHDGDGAIPNKRQELLERYVATCMRQELARPFPLTVLV